MQVELGVRLTIHDTRSSQRFASAQNLGFSTMCLWCGLICPVDGAVISILKTVDISHVDIIKDRRSASMTRTEVFGFSDNRLATANPLVPPPTMM